MLLSLTLFVTNLLPGQGTSQKCTRAQLSGLMPAPTDRVSPGRGRGNRLRLRRQGANLKPDLVAAGGAGPVTTALFSSKYSIPSIFLAEAATYY